MRNCGSDWLESRKKRLDRCRCHYWSNDCGECGDGDLATFVNKRCSSTEDGYVELTRLLDPRSQAADFLTNFFAV